MKNLLGFFLSFLFFGMTGFSQPVFSSKNGTIIFFSKTPMEDINATNKSVKSILNTSTRDVFIIASVRSFKFPKGLMEEHFNENYMESDKYPDATFTGKINDAVDFTKDGVYEITATGILKMHGVEQPRTEKGTLTIKGTAIQLHCDMKIKEADFKIEIPQLVFESIAPEQNVKIDISYLPYVKEGKK